MHRTYGQIAQYNLILLLLLSHGVTITAIEYIEITTVIKIVHSGHGVRVDRVMTCIPWVRVVWIYFGYVVVITSSQLTGHAILICRCRFVWLLTNDRFHVLMTLDTSQLAN